MNLQAPMRMVPLGEAAIIDRSGVAPDQIKAGTSYLGLEHIASGGDIVEVARVDPGDLASTKFSFGPEHVLFGKLRPYLAKIALPDFNGVCSTDIVPIRPGPHLDRRYLAHFLRQPRMVEFAASRATGVNLPRLSPKALAEIDIPLPPLTEQKRIAAILDQADALRRLRRRALDRLNALGQSIFHEMFGDPRDNQRNYPRISFGELCERVTVGIVVRPTSYYQDHGIPAIRGTNIQISGIQKDELVRICPESHKTILRKSRLRAGDLVIVRSGRPGLAAIVPEELHDSNAIDVIIATPDYKIVTSRFLCDLLNSSGGRALVLAETRGQVQ